MCITLLMFLERSLFAWRGADANCLSIHGLICAGHCNKSQRRLRFLSNFCDAAIRQSITICWNSRTYVRLNKHKHNYACAYTELRPVKACQILVKLRSRNQWVVSTDRRSSLLRNGAIEILSSCAITAFAEFEKVGYSFAKICSGEGWQA